MKPKLLTTLLFVIIAGSFLTTNLFAQQKQTDSLWQLFRSPRVKQMSVADLIKVQTAYPNKDKKLIIAFANELLGRKDLLTADKQRGDAYLAIGENYRNFGENDSAKKYLEASIPVFDKIKDQRKKAEALVSLGNYYANTGEDSVAMSLYTGSLGIGEANNDTIGILRPYRSITGLYLKMGLLEKALSYGFTGLQLAKKFNNEKAIATISNNIAAAYVKKKVYDSAIQYFQVALTINRRYPDVETVIRNVSNIGTTYIYAEKPDSAKKYLDEAERLLPQIDVPRTFIYTYAAIAELRNKQGLYRESVGYAKKVIETAKRTGMEALSDGAYETMVESYKGLKMPDSALVALENYWTIKQQFFETNRNNSVAKIEQQFQQYKKDNEITLLKKDQALGTTQRNGAIIAAILLAIAAFLFYNRFRLKKRTSDELTQKNSEIEKQKELIQTSLGEKETLLREIHHRVKNNLQIISSLLNIQSAHIQDENVLSSIQEGQSRVQAMSLIHQNLYQSEHLSNVDIENYLQQLVAYLADMYAGQDKSIAVSVDAPNINFDIDTAIPLGLIVNELVSNAYKYAFENMDKGKIEVKINPINEVDYELQVADNGKGFAENIDPGKSNSLGLKLVQILSRQLRGKFSVQSVNGALFLVSFKDIRAYQAAQR